VTDQRDLTFMLGELYALHRGNLQRISELEQENSDLHIELANVRAQLAALEPAYEVTRRD
jgi:hypothetical protein